MKHPDCPRWRAEFAHIHHVDKREIKDRSKMHRRTCPACRGWQCPKGLPRDPNQKMR